MVLHRHTKIEVRQYILVVIIQVESCEKLWHENVHQLIPYSCKINFFKSLLTIDGRTSKRSEYDYA